MLNASGLEHEKLAEISETNRETDGEREEKRARIKRQNLCIDEQRKQVNPEHETTVRRTSGKSKGKYQKVVLVSRLVLKVSENMNINK